VVRTYLSPVGRAHHANLYLQHPRARTSASIMGSELQPPALRSTPPRCPKPSPCCVGPVLRGTSGGATMTIPGGTGTYPMRKRSFLRARRIGFSHRVGVFSLLFSGPSLCPSPMLQGPPAPTFVDNGGRHPRVPRSPPCWYQSTHPL